MHGTHLKPSAKSQFTVANRLMQGEYGRRIDQPLLRSYRALGLQHDLNPISSGGSEVNCNHTVDPVNTCQPHPSASSSTIDDARSYVSEGPRVTSGLPKGFGRIVRDSSGNVVRVELPSDEEAGLASKQELVIDAPVVTESELRIWAQDHPETRRGAGSGGMEDTIIQGQLCICSLFDDVRFKVSPRRRHRELVTSSHLEKCFNNSPMVP